MISLPEAAAVLYTCNLQKWDNSDSREQQYELVAGAESDHTKDSKGKANGKAIHKAGNHTINLTVFLLATCSLPFSFTNF